MQINVKTGCREENVRVTIPRKGFKTIKLENKVFERTKAVDQRLRSDYRKYLLGQVNLSEKIREKLSLVFGHF